MLNVYEVFTIEKNKIKSKYDCSIKIIRRKYDEKLLSEANDSVTLPGILDFYFPEFDDFCQLAVPYQVNLQKTSTTISTNKEIEITYDKEDLIIEQKYVPDEVDIGLLNKILRGQVKYVNDPKILYSMIQNIIPQTESIYVEVILSNMFRDPKDSSKKSRLTGNYKDSTILGVNNQPYSDSWEKALAYERIDKAIQHGLINKNPTQSSDPITSVLREDYKDLKENKNGRQK